MKKSQSGEFVFNCLVCAVVFCFCLGISRRSVPESFVRCAAFDIDYGSAASHKRKTLPFNLLEQS